MESDILLKYAFVRDFGEERKRSLISLILKNIEVVLGHSVSDPFWENSLNFLFSNDDVKRNNFVLISQKCIDIIDKAIELSLPEM